MLVAQVVVAAVAFIDRKKGRKGQLKKRMNGGAARIDCRYTRWRHHHRIFVVVGFYLF